MNADALDSFLRLSEALTGFSRIDLLGTGLARTYLDTLIGVVGSVAAGELLLAGDEVIGDAKPDDPKVAAKLAKRVVGDARLGPLAKNVIRMWYIGSWAQLPAGWGDHRGAPADDVTRVVSAAAYREGLLWRAIGTHPPGAKQPGFGTWANPPREEIA
jgi:hypothetical protein